MQRGRAYSRGTNPWKITPSPLKASRPWMKSRPAALKNPVGEPYSGTDPKRLWLLRSRPDQVHRRTMRRGPPTGILAELRFACLLAFRLPGPGGRDVAPSPALPPGGRGFGALLRSPFWLASLCLAWMTLSRFASLARGGLAALCLASLPVPRFASLARGARCALPCFAAGAALRFACSGGLAALCLASLPVPRFASLARTSSLPIA